MSVRRLAPAAAALVVIVACSAEKVGNPAPERTSRSSDTTPSTTTTSTSRLLPPRPRELDLSGVDPCTDVLTDNQLHELAYDLGYQRAPIPNTSAIDNARTCGYSSESPPDQASRDIGSLVAISLSAGAEAWLTDPARKTSADRARQAKVGEFPALVLPNPQVVDNCTVVVDVHERQYFRVDSSSSGSVKGTSPEPYCTEAQRVAGMIIQTLSAR
jgi:hypothetical protein